MGYDSIKSQLMTVPPYAVGTVVCVALAYLSDRFKTRGIIQLGASGPLVVIAFVVLLSVENTGPKYIALFLGASGAFTGSPIFVGWLVENTAGPMVKAIASGFQVSLGTIGGLAATWTYISSQAPEYKAGHIINLCSGCVVIISATLLTINMRWENRQRALGKRDHLLEGRTPEEIAELGHTHPHFRYTP